MKRISILLVASVLSVMAQEEQKLSLLERIAQPKVTFQSDFLSDAKL